tara:strand:+ start:92586 stop:92780 length:195 start_codon:yes stop_codon:yes gene_type:complete
VVFDNLLAKMTKNSENGSYTNKNNSDQDNNQPVFQGHPLVVQSLYLHTRIRIFDIHYEYPLLIV